MTFFKTVACVVLAAGLVSSSVAFAHDAEPRYGGRLEHIGNFHVELVAKGKAVEVFLIDADGKSMKADGYKGLAILVVGGKSERIPLAIADSKDGNKLTGQASVDLPARPRGVVQITDTQGKAVSAKFD